MISHCSQRLLPSAWFSWQLGGFRWQSGGVDVCESLGLDPKFEASHRSHRSRKNVCHAEDPMAQLVLDFSLPQSRKRLSSFI